MRHDDRHAQAGDTSKRLAIFAGLLVGLLQTSLPAADRFEDLDAYIAAAMRKWEVPGLAIAVVKDGELVLARGYGVREIGTDAPVNKDTVFSIASCTKSFTAAGIGMLVDEGKLNWDDPVRKHLPDFEVADPYVTQHVTLRDLLCHRTGLVRGDLLFVKGDLDQGEILRRTRFLGQAVPFRTKVTYHNVMYAVLGEVIERKSGMTWQQFIAERFIEPLDMKSTAVSRTRVPTANLATRHRHYDGTVLPLRTPVREDVVAPAASIHSTAVDMVQWLKFHLREGQLDDRQLLKPDTVREMHALHQSIPIKPRPDSNVYQAQVIGTGLGWFVRDYRGHKIVQHGGGWGSEMAIVPDQNLGVVVLSNRDWNGLVWMLIYDVIDAYLLGPEQAWSQGSKWDHWLKIGGPDHMNRNRDEQRKQLDNDRVAGTKPSLPLDRYAGTYESDLYGSLHVIANAGHLAVRFGDHAAELTHWQANSFFGHAVVEPFLDWLVKFQVSADQSVAEVEVVSIGWKDPDERHIFRRK